jgi:pimeloyl-ACP methyl ester carboxylesterase
MRGVVKVSDGWRLSQDPRTFAVAGAPFSTLASSANARVALARGEHDSMVSTDELRAHSTYVEEVKGAGHNVHVEKPESIVALLEQLTGSCPSTTPRR